MNFILDCIKGFAIGAGAILPGISSGILCVVFGIYEKLVNSILNLFTDIKSNIKFLFPILIGASIGVIFFGNVLKYLFDNFYMQTMFVFIGIILGGIPSIVKTANGKNGFRLHYLIYTLFTFLLTLLLLYIENNLSFNLQNNNSIFYLVLSGFIMSIGVVVPGVSSTVLLMIMGMYDIYLLAISTINISILIPMGIGLMLGGFIFLKFTKCCLLHFHAQTYYSILGFVIGSSFILYPGFSFNLQGIICICFLFFWFFYFYYIRK